MNVPDGEPQAKWLGFFRRAPACGFVSFSSSSAKRFVFAPLCPTALIDEALFFSGRRHKEKAGLVIQALTH